jgi:hypothetical protein
VESVRLDGETWALHVRPVHVDPATGGAGRSFEVAGPECIWMLHLDRVRTQLSPNNLDPGAIVYRLS